MVSISGRPTHLSSRGPLSGYFLSYPCLTNGRRDKLISSLHFRRPTLKFQCTWRYRAASTMRGQGRCIVYFWRRIFMANAKPEESGINISMMVYWQEVSSRAKLTCACTIARGLHCYFTSMMEYFVHRLRATLMRPTRSCRNQ